MSDPKRFFELTKKIKEKQNKISNLLKKDDFESMKQHKLELIEMEKEIELIRASIDINNFRLIDNLQKLLNSQQRRTDREEEFKPLTYKFRYDSDGLIEVNLGAVDVVFVFDFDGNFKGIRNKLQGDYAKRDVINNDKRRSSK